MATPKFANRIEQAHFVFLKFGAFLNKVFEQSGCKTRVPLDKLQEAPPAVIVAVAHDLFNKYGAKLISGDEMALFSIFTELSNAVDMETIAREGVIASRHISKDPDTNHMFQRYITTIMQILEIK